MRRPRAPQLTAATQQLTPCAMTARELFHQAWRELRANGSIGYARLNAPHMRDAAVQCLRMRLERDALAAVRQRIVYGSMD